MKALLLLIILANSSSHANLSSDSAISARAQAMQSMQDFKPQDIISNFTPTPRESTLQPNGNEKLLKEETIKRLNQEETARFVISEEQHRIKIIPTQTEIVAADRLIEKTEQHPLNVGCADGSCDLTSIDVSEDINEGVSRLGAVAGAAQEVTANQIQNQQPFIFKGAVQECEKYMLGMRDCCTDDGFLDGVINCPRELQALQNAKHEHRVAYIGHYKLHRFSTTHYRYCVFPTRLAGIVQIQGRYAQLGLGFGNVWNPNCRGITPEELERINFKALDLSEMVSELVSKKSLPQDSLMDTSNSAHINVMYDKEQSHD